MAVTGLRGARAQSPPPSEQSSTSQLHLSLRSLRLSLASGYYSMVQALGLKRLNTLLQVLITPITRSCAGHHLKHTGWASTRTAGIQRPCVAARCLLCAGHTSPICNA